MTQKNAGIANTPEERQVPERLVELKVAQAHYAQALAGLADTKAKAGEHELAWDLYIAAGRAQPGLGHLHYFEKALPQYMKAGKTEKADAVEREIRIFGETLHRTLREFRKE